MDEAEQDNCNKCPEYDKCMLEAKEMMKLLEDEQAKKDKEAAKKSKTKKAK
jgi:hypothetical protein